MITLESDNLSEVLQQNARVIVQYGATWCGNCRMIKPKFKRLAEKTEGAVFVYADAEKFPESRKFANVSNLPAFALFENGALKGEVVGTKFEKVEEMVNAPASN